MVRKAIIQDFESFYKIKSEEDNLFWCGHDKKPIRENLFKFWKKHVSEDSNRTILTIIGGGIPVGYLYIDYKLDIELSVGVSCQYTGHGIATKAISEVVKELINIENKDIIAYIREDNIKSQHVFSKVGFKRTDIYQSMLLPTLEHEIKLYKWIYFGEEREC